MRFESLLMSPNREKSEREGLVCKNKYFKLLITLG